MKWQWKYQGFGNLLCGPEMQALMAAKAHAAKEMAEAIAPVDELGPHPGHYRASFEVEVGAQPMAKGRRAYATLRNTAPYAAAVEFGNRTTKAQHVLLRSIDAMGA